MTSLEALKEVNKYLTKYFNRALNRPEDTLVKWTEIDIIEKELKALEIIKKYIVLENNEDDEYELFPYTFKNKQYVSSGSCKVMSKKEYNILKEVFKWL